MYAIDKFYTDAKKTAKKSADARHCIQDLQRLFLPLVKDYGETGISLFQYWETTYGGNPEEHIDWLADLLLLLDGSMAEAPCFSGDDWKEIQTAISLNAESIDIGVLTSIMQIIMHFHGID